MIIAIMKQKKSRGKEFLFSLDSLELEIILKNKIKLF